MTWLCCVTDMETEKCVQNIG